MSNSTDEARIERIKAAIRDVPDFPKPGILFKDITPALQDAAVFRDMIDLLADRYDGQGLASVVGIDARGFILGGALADRLGLGFVPIRKKGKLPADAFEASYALEYGEATIEVHKDAVSPGEKVVLVDDLLATGGTAAAALGLLDELGADVVETAFLIELSFLNGRSVLGDRPVYAPLVY